MEHGKVFHVSMGRGVVFEIGGSIFKWGGGKLLHGGH